MNQMDLPFGSGEPLTSALRVIDANPEVFRVDFRAWLEVGWKVWLAFEREAIAVAAVRRHWSANTIIEYLRHQTMLRDPTDESYKFNDRWTSSMARLFVMVHVRHQHLFEFRERQSDGVVSLPPRKAA